MIDFTDCSVNVLNKTTNLKLFGKCIFQTQDALWLLTLTDDHDIKLLWIKLSADLEVAIDEYSEEDYSNLNISNDWKTWIDLVYQKEL